MDSTAAALRVERFLETEPVIWLSSIRTDGAPHLVPTWFVWDGGTIVIRSKPHAKKVRNLAHDPRAMVALGDAEDDFDVGLLEARAEVTVGEPGMPEPLPAAFVAKYRRRISNLGLTPAEFAATYSATIRLTPARALGWHGRSTPRSWLDAVRRLVFGRPTVAFGAAGAA
jgi:PPOX class probable F420-dependent enzyme